MKACYLFLTFWVVIGQVRVIDCCVFAKYFLLRQKLCLLLILSIVLYFLENAGRILEAYLVKDVGAEIRAQHLVNERP